MQKTTNSAWRQYRRRVRLDAILRSAGEILGELRDQASMAELEALRQRNVARMSKIQNAAYRWQQDNDPPGPLRSSNLRR
jgi:hypothetical protein